MMTDDELDQRTRAALEGVVSAFHRARPEVGDADFGHGTFTPRRPQDGLYVGEPGEGDRRTRRPVALLAVAAVAVVLAASALVAFPRSKGGHVAFAPGIGPRYSFVTQQVSLTADDFWIDVNGQRFTSDGAKVALHSDPGDPTYQTLELEWTEHGVPMAVNIYFKANGQRWWSNEVRTANGKPSVESNWVTFTGDFFRSSLGNGYSGTFDQTAVEEGVTSHFHIGGLRLRAFRVTTPMAASASSPSTDFPTIPSSATSTATGGVPAVAADLPTTGRAWTLQDDLALVMAEELLQRNCMVAKGWAYPTHTADFWQAAFGWQPDPVLSVLSVAGARASGYHLSDAKQGDPQEAYRQGLDPSAQQRFDTDMSGSQADMVPVETAPNGSAVGYRQNGGCFGQMVARFGSAYDRQEAIRGQVEQAVQDKATIAAGTDPSVVTALKDWGRCVQSKVGESAATPNELARRYAFKDGAASDQEKRVALADALCQQQLDLWRVYETVVAKAERALMGSKANDYDELIRLRQQIVVTARAVLAENGVAAPSLG